MFVRETIKKEIWALKIIDYNMRVRVYINTCNLWQTLCFVKVRWSSENGRCTITGIILMGTD